KNYLRSLAASGAFAVQSSAQGSLEVAAGDFNGDGIIDTVQLQGSSAKVTLRSDDGSVLSTKSFTVDRTAFFITTEDFNADGNVDLAISNNGNNRNGSVSILLGNGDGTFQPARNTAINGSPFSIVAVDFNGDNNLDIAVTDSDAGVVWVLLGNGNGTLQPARSFTEGMASLSMIAADFNGDGKADLAVANSGPTFSASVVSVLLGNGDGTFRPAVSTTAYTVGPARAYGNSSLAFADFNHDGKMDVARSHEGAKAITLLLGKGDGTFTPSGDYVAGGGPVSVGVAPLDDGSLFIATVDRPTKRVIAQFAPGDGTIAAPRLYGASGL